MLEQDFDALLEAYRWRFGEERPSLLDWTGSMRVRPKITDPPVRDIRPTAPARNTVVFGPAGPVLGHPDASVDVVVLDEAPSEAVLAEARRVARDAVVVWSRDGSVAVEWLRRPEPRGPEVSVIVHTPAAGERLDACLEAIAATTPATPAIELLVADASDSDPSRGPGAARNAAADEARGEVLVLVGEETVALPGWLRPLVRTLREGPDIGAVTGMLVAPDGGVQEVGR